MAPSGPTRLSHTSRSTVPPQLLHALDLPLLSSSAMLRPSRLPSALLFAALFSASRSAVAGPYRLPWSPGTPMQLTQDCNDACCSDHVGTDRYAWDFANGTEFPIVAAREGTVAHVKVSSNTGCGASSCANDANYLVIDHGDGTSSVYLHLRGGSLDPALKCGEFVRQGQALAIADSTGWSTGSHLHYQVNPLRADMSTTCECGVDGAGCAANAVAWNDFWSNAASPTSTISFDEWAADQCANRRLQLPSSTNLDAGEATFVVDDAGPHFAFVDGAATARTDPSYHDGFSSAPTVAAGSPSVTARYDFASVVTKPAVYEVWAFVPLSGHATATHAKYVVVSRGARAEGVVDQNTIGGGFHPLSGAAPKLKFSGSPGESVLLSNDTGDAGQEIAFDAVLLHEVGPLGAKSIGEPCQDATECGGTLVCATGVCAEGCEVAGCPCGGACDDTGLCSGGAGGCGPGAATSTSSAGLGASSGAGSGVGGSGAGGAGSGADGAGSTGCGCTLASPPRAPRPVAWIPAVLAAVLVRRRRRDG